MRAMKLRSMLHPGRGSAIIHRLYGARMGKRSLRTVSTEPFEKRQCPFVQLPFFNKLIGQVHKFHDARDRRVQMEPLQVFADFHYGLVYFVDQGLFVSCGIGKSYRRCNVLQNITMFVYQPPHPLEETIAAFHALIAPVEVSFRRRCKKTEQSGSIGTISFDEIIGVDHIAL